MKILKSKSATIIFFLSIFLLISFNVFSQEKSKKKHNITLEKILKKVEKRYNGAGFSAVFDQESTLKAIYVTDYASGKAFFKKPGKMRWEYELPAKQHIITNGKKLWIYQVDDGQVTIGDAPVIFGDGKGAGFLTDIKILRKKFNITLEPEKKEKKKYKFKDEEFYLLKLLPRKKEFDVSIIYLSVSKVKFEIKKIKTLNAYEDETIIEFKNIKFSKKLDEKIFDFKPPEGVDIIYMNEKQQG